MALGILVGLNVVDDAAYQSYRDEMTPILKSYGGGFGYDFRVSEVLKSKTNAPDQSCVYDLLFERRRDEFILLKR